jgi:CheY-like chemotaxis protein/AraC-like DNA-binding protein
MPAADRRYSEAAQLLVRRRRFVLERRRPVVLIVDDDRGIRGVLSGTLEGDYEVVEAVSGPDALEVFEQQRFDAVLLDIRMPGMGGLEVLRRMKAIEPRVEVILLSAVEEVPTVVEGMKAGAFDYVTKPWGIDDLLSRLGRAIRRREGEEILLVCDEVGCLAALHVVVERNVASAISVSIAAALRGYAGGRPRLVIAETPPEPTAAADLINRLRGRYNESPLLALTRDEAAAKHIRDTAGMPSWAVLAGQYHLGSLLEWIATAMPPLGETRVALPTLRAPVPDAIEHVIRHHAERLLAEDLARASGLSPRQLADAYHDSLGMSAKEFITRFRVVAACRLLLEGSPTLQQIAESTGFEDASHLSHVFNRYVGMRPGEYRRRLTAVG